MQQVEAVHHLLLRQQHLGAIASAAAVIEALPEALLRPVDPLRALLAALRGLGFGRQHLSALLTGGEPGLLDLAPAELAPRLAQLGQLLRVPDEHLPGFVAARPELLLVPPAQAAASVAWLCANLGWSSAMVRRLVERHRGLLQRCPAELEAAATLLQHRLDLATAELVLLLHIAPQLLTASGAELCGLAAAHPSALALARAAAPPPPDWDGGYAALALQQRLSVLKLCSEHALTLEEVRGLMRAKPTILREVRV